MANNEKKTKNFVGVVVSDKMDKTVTVKVDRVFRHPTFHKTVCISKKYKVHDEHGVASVGDRVAFYEGKPVSKTKHMYLDRIVKAHDNH
ncbi:MAG TPA: 30S ribosomal protein S17 [Candidatus Babeliales bacterium]|jgi:small subunit ribosomal protein S17|nr:30S ribosomal protein S17 [Candidatus Babeliales bacterium]